MPAHRWARHGEACRLFFITKLSIMQEQDFDKMAIRYLAALGYIIGLQKKLQELKAAILAEKKEEAGQLIDGLLRDFKQA